MERVKLSVTLTTILVLVSCSRPHEQDSQRKVLGSSSATIQAPTAPPECFSSQSGAKGEIEEERQQLSSVLLPIRLTFASRVGCTVSKAPNGLAFTDMSGRSLGVVVKVSTTTASPAFMATVPPGRSLVLTLFFLSQGQEFVSSDAAELALGDATTLALLGHGASLPKYNGKDSSAVMLTSDNLQVLTN